jgi:lipid-A-disaccharide synthase
VASKVLISAGEASGDLYASSLVDILRRRIPNLEFYGCAGPRMQASGVRATIDAASLAVVGLVEVVRHLPGIYREYQKLLSAVRRDPPQLAILTDSPDFHLRLARRLKAMDIPVIYLVAPQVWAWRKDRLPLLRRTVDRLLCIFPFEEKFFTEHGVRATYIGHPLTRLVKPSTDVLELRREFGVIEGLGGGPLLRNARKTEPRRRVMRSFSSVWRPAAGPFALPAVTARSVGASSASVTDARPEVPLIVLLPGSRKGEVARHLPDLLGACERIRRSREAKFLLALPKGFGARMDLTSFREPFSRLAIQVQEGRAWDALACADLALAASGTVTIEACLLKTPMITFYRVNGLSWLMGKMLVRVPFYSMVNLIAGREVVPEFIQSRMNAKNLADAALRLLDDESARSIMRQDLDEVARCLSGPDDPMEVAANHVEEFLKEEMVHVS